MDFKLGSQSHIGFHISGGTSGVDGEAHIAKAHQDVDELQVAVMQWELHAVQANIGAQVRHAVGGFR